MTATVACQRRIKSAQTKETKINMCGLEDDYTAARRPGMDGDAGVSEDGAARGVVVASGTGVDGAGAGVRG